MFFFSVSDIVFNYNVDDLFSILIFHKLSDLFYLYFLGKAVPTSAEVAY